MNERFQPKSKTLGHVFHAIKVHTQITSNVLRYWCQTTPLKLCAPSQTLHNWHVRSMLNCARLQTKFTFSHCRFSSIHPASNLTKYTCWWNRVLWMNSSVLDEFEMAFYHAAYVTSYLLCGDMIYDFRTRLIQHPHVNGTLVRTFLLWRVPVDWNYVDWCTQWRLLLWFSLRVVAQVVWTVAEAVKVTLFWSTLRHQHRRNFHFALQSELVLWAESFLRLTWDVHFVPWTVESPSERLHNLQPNKSVTHSAGICRNTSYSIYIAYYCAQTYDR